MNATNLIRWTVVIVTILAAVAEFHGNPRPVRTSGIRSEISIATTILDVVVAINQGLKASAKRGTVIEATTARRLRVADAVKAPKARERKKNSGN